ncbi:Tyrosinase co-factor MelC1 [Actinacidiphila alni]|uniref:Tyrosinase co-factor MelC1 n=1 Tax=Actinacidiphila alni TaxID=380248 RepID=A0A1I1ZKU1_9ACTN|nr:tyrosinase family oxidase copper chaperone [Actinacidiphila alni]SFE30960.1 Tyrosinase co-factor MelC1 [Actinacidiphila alni]
MSDALRNENDKPSRPRGSTRRRVIRRGLGTVAAVSGTAAALRPMLTARAGGDATALAEPPAAVEAAPVPGAGAALFDEVYRGRRIQGFSSAGDAGVDIRIDGRALGVMRRVDGSFISMANHYQPFPTALGTARAAVDQIGRAQLSANAEHHH